MALVLDFSVTESNDNKHLTITDTSGVYDVVTNPTGWGAPNLTVPGITDLAGAQSLLLNITITTSDGTLTAYDPIDLHSLITVHVDVTDLVFVLDCSMLKIGAVSSFTTDDQFPDGVYDIVYSSDGAATSHTNIELIDGIVENSVFKLLRMMNTAYEYEGCIEDTTIVAIFVKTYLDGIRALDVTARRQSVLDQLYTLERLLINTLAYDI